MIFINTRPEDRALLLTQSMRDLGVDVIELPLLELTPQPWSHALFELYSQIIQSRVIVVVSPTAAEIGLEYLNRAGIYFTNLSHVTWVAVGAKTAEVLKQYKIQSVVPEVETSEGMLNLPILQQMQAGEQISFWRGEGGRQFMMDMLTDQGMLIQNFILYTRQCPSQSKQKITEVIKCLEHQPCYIMLITSEASWLNWLSLIGHRPDILNKAEYWVLGDRLFEVVSYAQNQNKFQYHVKKLSNLKIENMQHQMMIAQGKL